MTSWGTDCDLKISSISTHSVVAQKALDFRNLVRAWQPFPFGYFALSEGKKRKKKHLLQFDLEKKIEGKSQLPGCKSEPLSWQLLSVHFCYLLIYFLVVNLM